MRNTGILLVALAAAGCQGGDQERGNDTTAQPVQDGSVATAYATGSDRLSPEELEANRLNMDWRQFVDRDATGSAAGSAQVPASGRTGTGPSTSAGDTAADRGAGESAANGDVAGGSFDETWDDITAQSVNTGPVSLPISGDVAGPSVLRVQILLDRVRFSPGIVDGRWGSNTEKAVYWLQRREGLPATGHVDRRTWERLVALADEAPQLVRTVLLTEEDVSGPFVTLPEEYYDRRDMECQCYESLPEKLAELYHTSEDLLRKLNPDVDLASVAAGTRLNVPAIAETGAGSVAANNVTANGANANAANANASPNAATANNAPTSAAGSPARIVISDGGRYLHVLDGSGRILYHFPATLGSDYSPSPSGDFRITGIAHDPSWHYQPDILEGVDDDEPDAVLPPGPNNAVGVVWMQLSRPHYGIHGTSAPETIGYATSNGCVRLTNWDAEFLARQISSGIPVEFRDVD